MGIHAGDHSIYPDCRQEFRDVDFEAFKLGNWGSEKGGYVYANDVESTTSIGGGKSTPIVDPQANDEVDSELPF